MKCAKSRNAKKSASNAGSLGTFPGWRWASSETMRGDAEPTWCTCSSALGRREMKPASADMAPSMSAGQEGHSAGQDLSLELVRQLHAGPGAERLPVDQDSGRGLDAGLGGGPHGRLGEVRVAALECFAHQPIVHARVDGPG